MRVHDYLDFHARRNAAAEFAVFGGRALSYADAQREANRIANAFVRAGLAKGDRVAVLAKNCADFALLYYGAFKAGVVLVPLNYRLVGPEWAYIANDAGARAVIARGELVGAIDAVRGDLRAAKRFVALDAAAPPGWESFADFVAGAPTTAPPVDVSEEDDVYQMYTSGTTGRPKGAVLTHRAVASNLAQFGSVLHLGPGDRYLIVAPLYHAAAAIGTFWCVSVGACAYIQEDFVPGEVVRAIAEDHIVAATLVPAMIQACLVHVPDVERRTFPKLRFVIYGASPISVETLRRAMEVFRCQFAQGFGMTETTAALTFLLPEDHERALREKPELLLSCGRALPGTELKIVDAGGRELPIGEVGEIAARGPQLMRGYWNLPEATAEALRGGWMHTGDAGRLDEEGFLYIQDRVKDMIVSGGENVYPREVEDVLFGHPAVADAAVIGVPSARWGEEVKAVIVLRAGAAASEDDLVQFCRGRLGGYKCPRSVDFVPALPRNPSGKVLKRELREPYWKGQTRRVS
jgi:acyl-CoA synthetase (AMP-forming)/AMP-acid ligase II